MTVPRRRTFEALAMKEDDVEDGSRLVDDAADVRFPWLVERHREQQPGALIDDGPMHEVQASQQLERTDEACAAHFDALLALLKQHVEQTFEARGVAHRVADL